MSAAVIAYIVVLGLLALYGAHRLVLTLSYLRGGARPEQDWDLVPALPDDLPMVTVQLPLYNEMYVAERVIDAAAALDWPRDRLEIQVLDDSTDETRALCAQKVAELRARGYLAEHLHRSDRTGFKAGALEAGTAVARGQLLLILDADFVPRPDLLRCTVGCFADRAVGMVQVRWEHLNRDYSTLTQVQALLLDGHFVVEQAVRHRAGRFFNFNGTAGLWRRSAIEDAGGWHHDTLTEDLDLSYRALLAGWKFRYLLAATAPAELPVHMNGFKSQQYRWAKGSLQVARKLLPTVLASSVPRGTKLEAFFHLTQNVPYLITLILALLTVPVLVLEPSPRPLWLELPLLFGTVGVLAGYCLTSQRAIGRDGVLRTLLRLPALVAVTAGISVSQTRAVLEGALGHQSEFVRTPKHGIEARGQRWRGHKYRGARTLIPIAEVSLAAYFVAALGVAVQSGVWAAVPIVALFAAGFGYVGVQSIRGH